MGADEGISGEEWVERFAAELGIEPPNRPTYGAVLKLAATAAHASERTAAPVACYLAGLTGRPLDELDEIAARIGPKP